MSFDLSQPTLKTVSQFSSRLAEAVSPKPTLVEAGEAALDLIRDEIGDTLVLGRLFATVSANTLPQLERAFAAGLAEKLDASTAFEEETLVLTLLGTRGREPAWNHRLQSAGHLAIPLLSRKVVEGIPMLAQVLSEMGLGLEWIDDRDVSMIAARVGRSVGVFHVLEAATATDEQGRNIVPDQEFVAKYGVRSVIGLGGSFFDGTFLVLLLFTSETVDRTAAKLLMPIFSAFKGATFSKLDRLFT